MQHYVIKVCQWLVEGQWLSLGTPVSSTNKTDITEILLKVEFKTITLILQKANLLDYLMIFGWENSTTYSYLTQINSPNNANIRVSISIIYFRTRKGNVIAVYMNSILLWIYYIQFCTDEYFIRLGLDPEWSINFLFQVMDTGSCEPLVYWSSYSLIQIYIIFR